MATATESETAEPSAYERETAHRHDVWAGRHGVLAGLSIMSLFGIPAAPLFWRKRRSHLRRAAELRGE